MHEATTTSAWRARLAFTSSTHRYAWRIAPTGRTPEGRVVGALAQGYDLWVSFSERHGREAPRFRRARGGRLGWRSRRRGVTRPAGRLPRHSVRHGEHARRLLVVGTGEAQRGRHEEARGARLAVPGGPRTSPTVRPRAHATQSICRSFGVNCASAAAPAMAFRMPSSSVGAVAPPGIPANSTTAPPARRRGGAAHAASSRPVARLARPRPLCPPRPARARRAGPRAARVAPTCRGARPRTRAVAARLPGPSADRNVSQSNPRLDNGHFSRRGGRVEGQRQHVAAGELLPDATVLAAPRRARSSRRRAPNAAPRFQTARRRLPRVVASATSRAAVGARKPSRMYSSSTSASQRCA